MRFTLALVLYRLLFLLLTPLLLVVLLLRSISHKAYRNRLFERLGLLAKNLKPHGIIVHAASVGEIIALKPFISQLLILNPDSSAASDVYKRQKYSIAICHSITLYLQHYF